MPRGLADAAVTGVERHGCELDPVAGQRRAGFLPCSWWFRSSGFTRYGVRSVEVFTCNFELIYFFHFFLYSYVF